MPNKLRTRRPTHARGQRPELKLLGEELSSRRLRANLSQADVGEYMGLSRFTIAQWERGERSPQIDDLCRLSGLYSVSVGEMVGRALNKWVPPTLKLVAVAVPKAIRRPNGRKRSA